MLLTRVVVFKTSWWICMWKSFHIYCRQSYTKLKTHYAKNQINPIFLTLPGRQNYASEIAIKLSRFHWANNNYVMYENNKNKLFVETLVTGGGSWLKVFMEKKPSCNMISTVFCGLIPWRITRYLMFPYK